MFSYTRAGHISNSGASLCVSCLHGVVSYSSGAFHLTHSCSGASWRHFPSIFLPTQTATLKCCKQAPLLPGLVARDAGGRSKAVLSQTSSCNYQSLPGPGNPYGEPLYPSTSGQSHAPKHNFFGWLRPAGGREATILWLFSSSLLYVQTPTPSLVSAFSLHASFQAPFLIFTPQERQEVSNTGIRLHNKHPSA